MVAADQQWLHVLASLVSGAQLAGFVSTETIGPQLSAYPSM